MFHRHTIVYVEGGRYPELLRRLTRNQMRSSPVRYSCAIPGGGGVTEGLGHPPFTFPNLSENPHSVDFS